MHEKWVVASSNAGKIAELEALLDGLAITPVSQRDFDVDDAVEDGIAFLDNALIKARHAASQTGLPAIADDSGLAVDWLDGAPGIFSARYAGTHGDDEANNAKLLTELDGVAAADRGAAFHCCLVSVRSPADPAPIVAHGVWRGRILTRGRGTGGFGYDPLFWVDSEQASAAELAPARKNTISHRGRAMSRLVEALRERRDR
ncbi:RdgB/HAM1 family non-canonical purine NTP pyrophosphatase [Salinisphaera sp. Q1T1-3]|uniref:RdgB/HAM1 family non-canonical purine NTP pyrophosphatase n=1 Tax=Salinisphaera sp. Q1T1-3 TaxID=2321229 RepID=UPI000E74E2B1|nr:RdgB/HAM1 family non-canonical purine NTP pyrophosphatase [Salinisphaera sp. Q1T1-3]RJS94318.1 RdgB/HAM1 family non-canonical purine NTP pyrophosphatase [Salinisphaera sp. Q1T1-3]